MTDVSCVLAWKGWLFLHSPPLPPILLAGQTKHTLALGGDKFGSKGVIKWLQEFADIGTVQLKYVGSLA